MLKLSFDCAAVNLPDTPAADESLADLLLAKKMVLSKHRKALDDALRVPQVSQYLEEFLLEDLPETFMSGKFVRLGASASRAVVLVGDR